MAAESGTPPSRRLDNPNPSVASTLLREPSARAFKSNGSTPMIDGGANVPADVDSLGEQSPLLPPRSSADGDNVSALPRVFSPSDSDNSWTVVTQEPSLPASRSSFSLFLLTICLFGLQISWTVMLSYGPPYLLSLGISKSLLALVLIAGPLSGTVVQPYIGVKSDQCRSRFGKRRPFMAGGAIATATSVLVLAWTREIVATFLAIFGIAGDSRGVVLTSILLAVVLVYILDFSINVVQAGVRALIVDNTPTHQQDTANAWASRISGFGNIVGYLFGYTDLPSYLGFFGNSQFKVLCMIAALAITSTVGITCASIKERDARLDDDVPTQRGVLAFFKQMWHSFRGLPIQIRRVCQVQFFAWIGWFPFLFYSTTYLGGVYLEPYFAENPNMTDKEVEDMWRQGTRKATFAMFLFAVVTLTSSVLIPFLVFDPYRAANSRPDENTADTGRWRALRLKFGSHRLTWLTLRRAWMLSHVLFFVLTWSTLAVRSIGGATALVACIGVPWALTQWAPFALIAAEISKRNNQRTPARSHSHDSERMEEGEEVTDQAGVVLGIHNMAIAAPQFISTLVASVVFRGLQKPRGAVGDDSVAWVLRIGGISALVAAWLTTRVSDGKP